MNKSIFEKLEQRNSSEIEIKAIYKNDFFYTKLFTFLKNQNYLDSKEIIRIINNNFIVSLPIGYVMLSKNNIVGFLGTIYSLRNYKTRFVKQCYLHTWIVANKFRFYSYKLIMPILHEDNYFFTYNPIKQLAGLYQKLGFKKITITKEIFFINFRVNIFRKKNFKKIDNYKDYYNFLNTEQKKIYDDHKNKNLEYFFFRNLNSSEYTFIIGKKSFKKLLPTFEILYNSNELEFKNNINEIKFEIFTRCKSLIFIKYYLNFHVNFEKKNSILSLRDNTLFVKNLPKDFRFDVLYSELI